MNSTDLFRTAGPPNEYAWDAAAVLINIGSTAEIKFYNTRFTAWKNWPWTAQWNNLLRRNQVVWFALVSKITSDNRYDGTLIQLSYNKAVKRPTGFIILTPTQPAEWSWNHCQPIEQMLTNLSMRDSSETMNKMQRSIFFPRHREAFDQVVNLRLGRWEIKFKEKRIMK